MKLISLIISLLMMSLALTSCSNNVSPNTYTSSQVGVANQVKKGVVVSKRAINIDNNSGMGGLAGAAGGAAAGSMVGGNTAVSIIGAIGGAVAGGLIGNTADKKLNAHQGYEYIVKLQNGKIISVTQAEDTTIQVKQRVLVIYGSMTRIVPDDTV